MKKNCYGCKALTKKITDFGYDCALEHPIEVVTEIDGIPVNYRPLEDCEKPKTNLACCELLLEKSREKSRKVRDDKDKKLKA